MRFSRRYRPGDTVLFHEQLDDLRRTPSKRRKYHAWDWYGLGFNDTPRTSLCGRATIDVLNQTWGRTVRATANNVCERCDRLRQDLLAERHYARRRRYQQMAQRDDSQQADEFTRAHRLAEGHRRLVRLRFDGESAWGEHIAGNRYRALNECLSGLPADFPSDSEHARHNGKSLRVRWGAVVTGEERQCGAVVPKTIVGLELDGRYDCPKCENSSRCCAKEE